MFVYDEKADQLTETIKEVGHSGASENDGSLILQNDQSMLQGGGDQSTSLQDRDDEQTKDMNASIYHVHSLNVDDHDLMVARGTDITCETEQNSDVQDHDRNGVSSVGKGVSCCANNANEKNEDLPDIELPKNALGAKDEDIKEITYEDTTRNNYNAESQQIGYIDYTSTHILLTAKICNSMILMEFLTKVHQFMLMSKIATWKASAMLL
jgi:hypothetical protein